MIKARARAAHRKLGSVSGNPKVVVKMLRKRG
jgi:hypothetical protein